MDERQKSFWIVVLIGLIPIAVALSGLLGIGGEVFWFMGWPILIIAAYIRWSDKAALPCIAIVLMLAAHVAGFKIYGSPKVVERPAFQSPLLITRLEPPNRLHFSDGRTATLSTLAKFVEPVDFMHDLSRGVEKESALGRILRAKGWRHSDPLQLEVAEKKINGDESKTYDVSLRNSYFCGNYFFPRLFPQDLPSHRSEDLELFLYLAEVIER